MIEGFSHPWAFAWSALAIPILLTYMLKARRTRYVVPSIFLWKRSELNVAASKPWQRLRPTILLFLQLLALVLLVIVLARPYRSMEGVTSDHLVLVIDSSGSMLATDHEPDRMSAAKTEALDLMATLPASSLASVISAGSQPHVVVSSTEDRPTLRRAISRLEASQGSSNMQEAMLLAESLEIPNHPATIALISDGGISPQEQAFVPPGTIFRQVGRQATNLGIAGLDVGEAAGGFRAFVTVANAGSKHRSASLTLKVDGTPVVSSRVSVAPDSRAEKSFELGSRTGKLTARLEIEDDLVWDNEAYAVLERTRPRRIQLVSTGNLFLEKLLVQLEGAKVDVTAESADGDGYDLVVYDRVPVPSRVKAPAMFVAPSSLPKGVVVDGEIPAPAIDYLAPDPLLDQVDLSDLAIAKAMSVKIEASKTLVGAGGSPLIATWSEGTLRRVWIGFDLHESNLPVQVAFPILGDHLLGWLTGAAAQPARVAGQVFELPVVPGATSVRVSAPQGTRSTHEPGESFTQTDVSGFYDIASFAGDRVISEATVALSFPPQESALLPVEIPIGSDDSRPGLVESARRPALVPFLIAVLILLTLEWWWGHGRPLPTRASARSA